MHFKRTLNTPVITKWNNIEKLTALVINSGRHEFQRHFARKSPTTVKGDGEISKGKKPVAPIVLPNPPGLKTPPVVKKKVTIFDNLPGAEKLIVVNDNNFETLIKIHKSMLIMFYGSWCSVCRDYNVEIAKAAAKLQLSEGALGICDAMENVMLIDKFVIKKTPSLKYFKNGKHIADYIGKPMATEILKFMKSPPSEFQINM